MTTEEITARVAKIQASRPKSHGVAESEAWDRHSDEIVSLTIDFLEYVAELPNPLADKAKKILPLFE